MIAFDLFAGVGWGLACRALGITDRGVDNVATVVETRRRAGLETVYNDVWDGLFGVYGVGRYQLLTASPPCQTFSPAGKGAGRKALDEVLAAIRAGLYRDPVALHELTVSLDPRTALVLTPLAHVYRDRPQYVVLEQVVPVLPVWGAYAVVMRELGYSVVTGILSAEQFGVPQTRRRAILIARRDGLEAFMPTPTHSRFYAREPKRRDADVQPWISMADALGWGLSDRPSPTITGGGTETGGAEPIAKLARYTSRPDWVHRRPSPTVVATRRSSAGILVGRQLVDGSRADTGGRSGAVGIGKGMLPGVRVTADEAGVLQSFPRGFDWAGGKGAQFLQIGNAVPPLLGQHVLAAATAGALNVAEAVAA
jgi:DNA (cytosine-5)-methyltransferase 1